MSSKPTVMARTAAFVAALVLPLAAQGYVVTIAGGTRSIYLQVGTGTMTGGNFNAGGTPGSNATVNQVTVTVPASNLGTGTLPMTTNSAVTNSPYDGFAFCPVTAPARSVYVGGFYRNGAGSANATLTVTSPANLASGANTIPFNNISWVSSGNSDATPTIPSGSFPGAGGTQTLLSVTRNTWFESCMQFNYANSAVFPAGTYTNRVTYTLTVP
jgi:hypothetical protein